jgi:ankyrin repeat protein
MYKILKFKWLLWYLLISSILIQCNTCSNGDRSKDEKVLLTDFTIENIKDDELRKLIERLNKGEELDVNRPTVFGELPLELALKEYNAKEIVKFLLAKGANVNIKGGLGNTPLMMAASGRGYREDEIIYILIKAGAEKDAQNNQGETALMVAVKHSQKERVDVLVKAGVDVNKQDQAGKTALHLAIGSYNRDELVKNLLKSPQLDLLARDHQGNLVFHEIAEKRQYSFDEETKKIVMILINKIKSKGLNLPLDQWKNKARDTPWDLVRALYNNGKEKEWLEKQLTSLS